MNLDKSTHKIIFLAIVGVSIAILALVFAYFLIFNSSDTSTTDKQFTTFPDGGIREIPGVDQAGSIDDSVTAPQIPISNEELEINQNNFNYDEIDWRDEIIQPNSYNTVPSQVNVKQSTTEDAKANIDALYAAAETLSNYKPKYPDEWAFPTNNLESMSFSEYSKMFDPPVIDTDSFTNCKEINLPSNASEQERSISDLENNSSTICMGKAVANNCTSAKAVVNGDVSQTVYVMEREDGECSIGTAYGNSAYVSLCSIKDMLNAMTGEKKEFSEWRIKFSTEPGKTFAALYFGSLDGLSKAITTNALSCKSFKL